MLIRAQPGVCSSKISVVGAGGVAYSSQNNLSQLPQSALDGFGVLIAERYAPEITLQLGFVFPLRERGTKYLVKHFWQFIAPELIMHNEQVTRPPTTTPRTPAHRPTAKPSAQLQINKQDLRSPEPLQHFGHYPQTEGPEKTYNRETHQYRATSKPHNTPETTHRTPQCYATSNTSKRPNRATEQKSSENSDYFMMIFTSIPISTPSLSAPPSTSSSSVGSDTETGVDNVPPTPPRRTRSALGSPESVPSVTASLGHLSLDHAPPSDSEVEESETEKLHACTDGKVATTACEGCQRLEERLKSLQMEHTARGRIVTMMGVRVPASRYLVRRFISTNDVNLWDETLKSWNFLWNHLRERPMISVSNRLSATVADLHTVKKAMEEMDTRARAEKALFEEQTASFEQRISQLSQRLDSLLKQYQEYRRSTESEFSRLEQERAIAQMELSEVEEHYRTLLRKRHDAAAEMSAPIDLPSSREDLELYALQMREDLLSTGVACEHLRNRLDTETATNRDRLNEERWKRIQMEELLRSRTRDANERIAEMTRNFEASKQSVERATERASAEVKRLQAELAEKDKALQRACDEVAQLRNRVSHLQTDLENTEKVSLDFVRLSQHLQIQLERQREQTQEVRWQDPEDVIQCSGCKRPFEAGMVKQNCRHCGAIFCRACLTKVIPPSGARSRPAHVCDMCHTLLVKDAAPYFSSGTFPHADGESSPPSATPATLRKSR
ncbi:unnamed protein product [Taenia asiatica]|uniref:FYVE-type domain-containing protein n=1 Tax=Taenia asiatica TaxID=60517 RepID=A0A158R768_TAEAS|nr:unnamed protein product [Taenia asiatica]